MEERHAAANVAPPHAFDFGTQALALLANPLNVEVIRAHATGPLRLSRLQEQMGWVSQSSLRVTIRSLRDIDILMPQPLAGAPYAVVNELTRAGTEMLLLADGLDAWLARAPGGPIEPGSNTAKTVVKALAGGWDSNIVRTLASQPLTLTELARSIPDVSYPSLERRLTSMRIAGQLEPVTQPGRGTPYAATEWLRRSSGLLCQAARWEQLHMHGRAAGITGTGIETVLLLAIRLPLPLPESAGGQCLLATPGGPDDIGEPALSGITVEVQGGKVVSAVDAIDRAPPNWALGTPEGWLDAILDGGVETLRTGGVDSPLAVNLAQAVHLALFKDQIFHST